MCVDDDGLTRVKSIGAGRGVPSQIYLRAHKRPGPVLRVRQGNRKGWNGGKTAVRERDELQ